MRSLPGHGLTRLCPKSLSFEVEHHCTRNICPARSIPELLARSNGSTGHNATCCCSCPLLSPFQARSPNSTRSGHKQGPLHAQVLKQHDLVRTSLARPSCRPDVMITPCNCFHFVVGAGWMSMQCQRATSKSAQIAPDMLKCGQAPGSS